MNRSVFSRFRGLLASAAIAFSAVAAAQVAPLNAGFGDAGELPVPVGGTAVGTLYIFNPNASTVPTAVTMPMPPGVTVVSVSSSVCDTVTDSSTPGQLSFVVDLPSSSPCLMDVTVSATAPGFYNGTFTLAGSFGTQTLAGSFRAYLPASVGMSFSPNPVGPGLPSTLLVTIQNPDPNHDLLIEAGIYGGNADLPIGTWDSAAVTGTNPPGCAIDALGPILAKGQAKVAGPLPYIEDLGNGDGPELFFSAFVPPGGSCVISVQVVSSAEGSFTAPPFPSTVPAYYLPIFDANSFSGSLPVTPGTLVVGTATGPSFTPARLDFPPIPPRGSSGPLEATLTNAGALPISLLGIQLLGSNFAVTNNCLATLGPGGSCSFSVTFSASVAGPYFAEVRVVTDAATLPVILSLSGSVTLVPMATLTADPARLSFDEQVIGTTSSSRAVTITNTGDAAANIGAISATGDFTVNGTCPFLPPLATCTLNVAFKPTATGTRSGQVIVTSDAANPALSIGLTGNGRPVPAPRVRLSATALDFGDRILGAVSSQTVTVTNVGDAELTLGNFSISGDFRLRSACPATLAPTASCLFDVDFLAAVPGTRRGQASFTSNAGGSPHSVSLSGKGCRLAINGRSFGLDCGR